VLRARVVWPAQWVDAMKVGRVRRNNNTEGRTPSGAKGRRRSRDDGQTLIEFAFLLPVLCLLAVGIVEIGRAAAFTIAVNNAATAGVEYGSQSETTAKNINGMQTAATNDANFNFGTITAIATYGCLCDHESGASCTYPVPAQTTCEVENLNCDDGQIVQCVQVTTNGQWDSLLHYPGIPDSFQANGRAVMRVRR